MEKNPVPPPYAGPDTDPGYGATSPPYPYPGQHGAPPPPQYGMNQPTQVVTVVVQPNLTDVPGHIQCPHCQSHVVTQTKHESGLLTWLLCGGMCLFLFWPCAFIPFCVDSCKDVEHTCPNCHQLLSRYKRL